MKAENRHFTSKWKKRRAKHFGDRCHRANCPICAAHKNMGNSSKADKRSHKTEKELVKFELTSLT